MVLIAKIPIFSGVRGRLCCVSDNLKGKGNLALKEKLFLGNPKIRYKCVIGLEIFLKPKNKIASTFKPRGRWFKPFEQTNAKSVKDCQLCVIRNPIKL